MVDKKTNQPYLTDWYLYFKDSIKSDRYQAGLENIENLKNLVLSQTNH